MQFVKTLLIVAVLAAVTYGVYAALTGKSDVAPPPGAPSPDQTGGAPQIELPSVDAQPGSGIPGVVSLPGTQGPPAAAPVAPSALGEAPRYSAPAPTADPGSAPPFVTPGVGPGDAPPAANAAPPIDVGAPAVIPGAPPAAAPAAPTDPAAGLAPPATGLAPPAVGLAPPADAAPPVAGAPPPAATDPAAPPGGAPPAAGAPPVAPPPAAPAGNYQTDITTAQGLLQQGQLDAALLLMSRWYGDASLSEADQAGLLGLLNQLAGTVIYSRENWLAEPYEVQPGDKLDQIAARYKVPPQLMAKINGIADPNNLQPGTKLKTVPGPFDAVVDMKKRFLILKLQGRFAGRFPIGVGAEHAATDGEYAVKGKIPNPHYYGERVVPPEDPANPLGKYWIDLGDKIAIHGTNDPSSLNRDDPRGCIRMHPRDIEDVYDMVTQESRVTILR